MSKVQVRVLNDIRHLDTRYLAQVVNQLLQAAKLEVVEFRETKLDSRGFPYDVIRHELRKKSGANK